MIMKILLIFSVLGVGVSQMSLVGLILMKLPTELRETKGLQD